MSRERLIEIVSLLTFESEKILSKSTNVQLTEPRIGHGK